MPSISYEYLHLALVAAVPEFRPVLDEHVADFDEVLPHVLFGDLTRFVLAAHERGDTALVSRSLEWLDRALRGGDERVQNVVAVSFVENVGVWDEALDEFVASWPAALREEARSQRDWRPIILALTDEHIQEDG